MQVGQASRTGGASHSGPPPAAPLIASVVAFLGAMLIGPIGGAGTVPTPTSSTAAVTRYYSAHASITALSAWLLLLSAVLLAFFGAVLYSRLLFLAPNAPGPVIAGFGTTLASGMLAMSAVTNWVLSRRSGIDNPAVSRALSYLQFVAGGPAHVAALGLVVVGVAVTTLFLNRTPRLLALLGIALAALDLIATVSMVADAAGSLVALGRDASLAWLIVVCVLLPRERAARRRDPRP